MPLPIDPLEALKKEVITITLDGIETMALITILSAALETHIPEDAKEALRSLYKKLGSAIESPPTREEQRQLGRKFNDEHTEQK